MTRFVTLALVGLAAQLVDGTLGMAYGVTTTTLLLAAGYAAAASSAAVHLAEIGTTLASGISHWRFGNVDWKLVLRLGVPGAVGAFAGAMLLSHLATETAAPWTAGILLVLGLYILTRFAFKPWRMRAGGTPSGRSLVPLGLVGGFLDASGGGGWGPVATPTLLATGRVVPRRVIGSVDASEFLVAIAASVGFLLGLGSENIPMDLVAPILVGGLLAAPIAAWLVRHLPLHILGVLVGGMVVMTNARTIMGNFGVPGSVALTVYGVVATATIAGTLSAIARDRRPADVDETDLHPEVV
ncbi:sulfite exporter TauE/SafE family protein [soil metagenome]